MVLSNEKLETELNAKKSVYLLNILREYSSLIVHALNIDLEENSLNGKNLNGEISNNGEEDKLFFKTFEKAIESKLISIDLISSISEYFIKGMRIKTSSLILSITKLKKVWIYFEDNESQPEEEDYESWEDCESESEMDNNNNSTKPAAEFDIEMDSNNQLTSQNSNKLIENSDISELKSLIQANKLMSLLIKTICKDDENSFQETERIAHICNSIKLIRTEAAKAYSLLVENFYLSGSQNSTIATETKSDIELDHLLSLLNLLSTKPVESFTSVNEDESSNSNEETEALLAKLLDLIYDLFTYFNELSVFEFSLEQRMQVVELIKQILFKYKVDVPELCIQMARIVGLMAIKLRNNYMNEAKPIIAVNEVPYYTKYLFILIVNN